MGCRHGTYYMSYTYITCCHGRGLCGHSKLTLCGYFGKFLPSIDTVHVLGYALHSAQREKVKFSKTPYFFS